MDNSNNIPSHFEGNFIFKEYSQGLNAQENTIYIIANL